MIAVISQRFINMNQTIQAGIIEELKKGDRFASELKDALQIKRYPDLWTAIATLEQAGEIEHFFRETPPSATLAYRIKRQVTAPASRPILPWRANH